MAGTRCCVVGWVCDWDLMQGMSLLHMHRYSLTQLFGEVQAAPAKQLKRMMSATATASSRLLKQDHRLLTQGAMLKTLGTKPEAVVVSLTHHKCLSSDSKA